MSSVSESYNDVAVAADTPPDAAFPNGVDVPSTAGQARATAPLRRYATIDPPLVRCLLIGAACFFLALLVLVPTVALLTEAFRGGFSLWLLALRNADALAAVRLTLLVAVIAVPLNALFGLAAAWSITRFRYRGKNLLTSLIDLPFGVSPVISGMMVILVFGAHGWLGPWLSEHHIRIVFALPGLVLATVFVTFPFVARELIPFMQAMGQEEEEAAFVLGASGWQILTKVTLPNIRWSLFYGIVLCNARAMGEFGAVSVVSGHIQGTTNTIPLHVEVLYNDYAFQAAFAVASLLFFLALITLVVKKLFEWKQHSSTHVAVYRRLP
jgi:sulfate/thiosulfate transport system permease protein